MIHTENVFDQLDFCVDLLACLTSALTGEAHDENEPLAVVAQQTQCALKDAVKRLKETRKSELEAAKAQSD
jgi:hypothetical protein